MWVTREALHSLDLSSVSDGDGFQVCNSVECCDGNENSFVGNQIDVHRDSKAMIQSDDVEYALGQMMNLECELNG